MAELRKTGESQYEVLVGDEAIGHVWSWHGTWSAQAGDKPTITTKVGSRQ